MRPVKLRDRSPWLTTLGVALTLCLALQPLHAEEHAGSDHARQHNGPASHAHHGHSAATPPPVTRTDNLIVVPPAVKLVRDDGTTVDLATLLADERPLFVNFIYTSCTSVCPVMSATFSALEQELRQQRSNARLVSISIDPDYDTPERLTHYAARYRTGKDWLFLTGSAADSIAVQKAFDAYTPDKMAHEVAVFYRRSPASPWVRFDGFASAAEIAGAAR